MRSRDLVTIFGSQTVHQSTPGHCSKLTGMLQDLLIFTGNTVIWGICHTRCRLLARDDSVSTLEHYTLYDKVSLEKQDFGGFDDKQVTLSKPTRTGNERGGIQSDSKV